MYALAMAIAISAPRDEPSFIAIGPGDERPVGRVLRLSRNFTATLLTGAGEAAVGDLVSLRRSEFAVPPLPTGPQLISTAGDRLAGRVMAGAAESLQFLPAGIRLQRDEVWKVPLSSIAAVWFTDTPADTPLDPSRYPWAEGGANRDVLRLRNGDSTRGSLDSFDPKSEVFGFPFRPEHGAARAIPAGDLAAIVFNPALARHRKPKGPYSRLVLTDGSRLVLTDVTIADGILGGTFLFGQKVELPLTLVAALDVQQGKAIYLSDLKPRKVEQTGFLGVVWPWAADRTVRGTSLRIATPAGVSTADRGLGTHPRTRLSYDLGGKYRRFEAVVGIDPDAAVHSRIAVRILVDGREQTVTGLERITGRKSFAVQVNVRDAKELVLLTDFGPDGGVGAAVNWADARLVE